MRDEKLHAVVARSTFPSQNVQNTPTSDHFSKLNCAMEIAAKDLLRNSPVAWPHFQPFSDGTVFQPNHRSKIGSFNVTCGSHLPRSILDVKVVFFRSPRSRKISKLPAAAHSSTNHAEQQWNWVGHGRPCSGGCHPTPHGYSIAHVIKHLDNTTM